MESRNFIAAVCPSCGANIELDKKLEHGFCSYCGAKIIIKDIVQKVRIVNHPTAENYFKLANREYENGNYQNAFNQFEKALEIEADNWQALYRRGICIAMINSPSDFKVLDILNGLEDSIELLEVSGLDIKEQTKLKVDMVDEVVNIINELYKISKKGFWINIFKRHRSAEGMMKIYHYAIKILNGVNDETYKSSNGDTIKMILNNIYVSIVNLCVDICHINVSEAVENHDMYVEMYRNYVAKMRITMPYYKAPSLYGKNRR